MKKIAILVILFFVLFEPAWAQSFLVKKIEIQGLQRISAETVENYLPIKQGQWLRSSQTPEILRALYRTGFFAHIDLAREDNTLIIHVVERPTIGQLKITGNSVIATDKLNPVMKSLDLAEGRVYNPAILDKIKQGLLSQYYQLGRYNARVAIIVTPMPRNRVMISIEISEGLVAKIRRITIIGNGAFTEKKLIRQLDITTPNVLTFFTQSDRYSEARLDASLERLRAYYLDRGYLHFEIKSSQAEISPDRKSVYVTIVINEGEPYILEDYEIAGPLIAPREEYIKRIRIKRGECFSRQKVIDSEKAISTFLGEQGYMFATVTLRPRVNDATHKVILLFDIRPGKRTYVRRITFSDNNRTNEIVLRREIQQMEGAPASTIKLEDSKHRLSLLPYIKDVDMSVNPVLEEMDQVDINYKVKEDNSAQISFKLGLQQDIGLILAAGLNQKNFMGTGNTLGINLQRSKYEQFFGFDYTNPYYTEDGISRSLSLHASRVNPQAIQNLTSGYAINEYDVGVSFGIPVGQELGVYSRILAGASYQNFLIDLDRNNPGKVSNQVNAFVQRHGRRFQQLDLQLGYSRTSLNRAFFPTCGAMHTIFLDAYVPVSSGSLTFYLLNYHGKYYFPLTEQFIFLTRTDLGYGNALGGPRNFPFFKNFYAGGIDTVRGYQTYTLGPRDSNDQTYGGNVLADASLALIFPNYISDNLRTSVFVDAGNVYSSLNNRQFGCNNLNIPPTCSTNSGPIRYSVGIEADWLSPFGPITLSLAQPINLRPGDKVESFQFAISSNF